MLFPTISIVVGLFDELLFSLYPEKMYTSGVK